MTRHLVAFIGIAMLTVGCGGAGTEATAPEQGSPGAALQQQPAVPPGGSGGARRAAGASGAVPEARAPEASRESAEVASLPEYREVTLPAGTGLSLRLASAVASDTSQVEDVVRATLTDPVLAGGATVLPAGTELAGTVTDVERSGRVKGLARLALRFGTVRYQSEQVPVRTETIERVAESTKGKDAAKVGVGAGVGAALGAVLGGGDGAATGAAIGAAAGTGAVLATRGEEVRLGPGDVVQIRLAAPLTLRVPVGS